MGGIEQLGFWKEFKCHMKWTANHIWVSDTPVLIGNTQSIFQYKYVLINGDKKLLNWERGVDRIADLSILPSTSLLNNKVFEKMVPIGRSYKNVEIQDIWEKFTVSFTVFHPF